MKRYCTNCKYETFPLPTGRCSGCANYYPETNAIIKKFRNEKGFNVGELIKGTKKPKYDKNGKVPWHEITNNEPLNIDNGICCFLGKTSGNVFVLDPDVGFDEMWPSLEPLAKTTFTVRTGSGRAHIYFRCSADDLPENRSMKNEKNWAIEIKSQGLCATLPPTLHEKTGKPYEILYDNPIKTLTKEEIDQIYKLLENLGFGIKRGLGSVSTLHDKNYIKIEGQNRGLDLLRVIGSWKIKNPELNEEMLYGLANNYQDKHFRPPYPEDKVKSLVKQGFEWATNVLGQKWDGKNKIDITVKLIREIVQFQTLRKTDEILMYNGKIYDSMQAETVIKEYSEIIIKNCTEHERREVINKIKAQTYTDLENFDKDPNLVTVLNGILNLKTLELSPHTPDHLSRVLLPVKYQKPTFDDIEENLKNTLFWKYLKSSFTVDGKFRDEDFHTVLEIIASFIVKRHVDEKAFMFLGVGENGKSVCLYYIGSLLGENNVSNISLQDISDDKFMRANLAGKSANIFPDLEQNELRHTGKIKAITSNEGIEVQKKHQQGFTLYPFCKLIFSCNKFPKVFDQTQGFFRRWIIVKWQRNFENDPERIEYLKEKLAANQEEKNLVFSCLVKLANQLNTVGKFTHSKDWKEIQRMWNENADPIDEFVTNYIIDSENHKTKREIYQFYKKIMLSKGVTPLGMGQFGKLFAEYHDDDRIKDGGRTERVWLNIDFKEPVDTHMEDFDNS